MASARVRGLWQWKAVGYTVGAEAEVGLGTVHPKEGNGSGQGAGSERSLGANPPRFP